jgi:hypothetical protein
LRTQHVRWFFITGLAWFFLFLTKYNYAAFALVAIALVELGERLRRAVTEREGTFLRRLFSLHNVLTFMALALPVLAGLAFWFLGGTDIVPSSVKWRDFSFFVTNENSGYSFWSEQNLLFYVRTAANWLMPHPLLALAALLGAGWAVTRIRHPGVTLLALYFVIGFVLATTHPLKSDRYVTPVFPALWALTGLGAADLLALLVRQLKPSRARIASIAAVLAVLLVTLISWVSWLPRLQPVWYGGVADGLRAASNQIVAWQQPQRPVLIIGTFGELSPPLFEWRLRTQAAFGNGNIQYDAPPGDGSDIERVQQWVQANPGTQVTLIRVSKDAVLYNTNDMLNKNAGRQRLVNRFDQVRGYVLVQTVSYPKAGLEISYYLPQ